MGVDSRRKSVGNRFEARSRCVELFQITEDLRGCELETQLARCGITGLFDPVQRGGRVLPGAPANGLEIEPVWILWQSGEDGVGHRFRIDKAMVTIGGEAGLGTGKGFLRRHRHVGGDPVIRQLDGRASIFPHRKPGGTSRKDRRLD